MKIVYVPRGFYLMSLLLAHFQEFLILFTLHSQLKLNVGGKNREVIMR